jgi:hypothetical protein
MQREAVRLRLCIWGDESRWFTVPSHCVDGLGPPGSFLPSLIVFPLPYFALLFLPQHSYKTARRGRLTISNRADATIASQATGAMSWAFITALKKNPQQSYVQLLNSIRDELAKRYTQKPQLSASHPLGE